MSMFSLKGWGWDREGCLFTSVQGYYVLGKMQDLMKQDFLGATEPPGRKALSAALSSQQTGPERKEFNWQHFLCCQFVHCKDGETAKKSREITHVAKVRHIGGLLRLKERFRPRASLEERIARRQPAGGSLFISYSISILYQNVRFLLFLLLFACFFLSYLFQFALTGNLALNLRTL